LFRIYFTGEVVLASAAFDEALQRTLQLKPLRPRHNRRSGNVCSELFRPSTT